MCTYDSANMTYDWEHNTEPCSRGVIFYVKVGRKPKMCKRVENGGDKNLSGRSLAEEVFPEQKPK